MLAAIQDYLKEIGWDLKAQVLRIFPGTPHSGLSRGDTVRRDILYHRHTFEEMESELAETGFHPLGLWTERDLVEETQERTGRFTSRIIAGIATARL